MVRNYLSIYFGVDDLLEDNISFRCSPLSCCKGHASHGRPGECACDRSDNGLGWHSSAIESSRHLVVRWYWCECLCNEQPLMKYDDEPVDRGPSCFVLPPGIGRLGNDRSKADRPKMGYSEISITMVFNRETQVTQWYFIFQGSATFWRLRRIRGQSPPLPRNSLTRWWAGSLECLNQLPVLKWTNLGGWGEGIQPPNLIYTQVKQGTINVKGLSRSRKINMCSLWMSF